MEADDTQTRIARHLPEVVAIRREIHAHPELGMEERRTAALVAERLRAWGLETTEGVGRFGVVGTLKGRRPGQGAIGLRADMDALAMAEQTGLPYASTVPGRMHAYGHDGHTAMLPGAARVLAEDPNFAGRSIPSSSPPGRVAVEPRPCWRTGSSSASPVMPSMGCTTCWARRSGISHCARGR